MIRTETLAIAATAAELAKYRLQNVYGFLARRVPGGGMTFPLLAFVKYQGDETERAVLVFEGEPVHGARLMERVRLGTSAGSGSVYVTVADEPADRLGNQPGPTGLGEELYDSGNVAAGAAIDSGVLDLSRVRELEITVDNTAGTVLRDLSLLSYRPDGATLVDLVVLRRVAFGAAPTGSVYAPGRVRGYVGPQPPGGVTGTHVLYAETSGAGAALGGAASIVVEDAESVDVLWDYSGANVPASAQVSIVYDDGGGSRALANGLPGAGATGRVSFAPSSGVTNNIASVPAGPHRRIGVSGTAGAASTVSCRVVARGRVPGTFSVPLVLPTRARLTLAAGGAGAARMTVFGR